MFIIKLLAGLTVYGLILALIFGSVYLANPGFKEASDRYVLDYLHRQKVNRYQEDQLEGKIKILVPISEL